MPYDDPTLRRTHQVRVWMNTREFQALKHKAASYEVSMGEVIRRLTRKLKPRAPEGPPTIDLPRPYDPDEF